MYRTYGRLCHAIVNLLDESLTIESVANRLTHAFVIERRALAIKDQHSRLQLQSFQQMNLADALPEFVQVCERQIAYVFKLAAQKRIEGTPFSNVSIIMISAKTAEKMNDAEFEVRSLLLDR